MSCNSTTSFTAIFVGLLLSIHSLVLYADSPATQESLEPSPIVKIELANWVSKLESAEFSIRREAFLQLWKAGRSALPLVSLAKDSPSRRVAEAAAILETLIELNFAPERQHESAKLLDVLSNPSPQAILELCEMKYWPIAERMLRENSELLQKFQDPYGRFLLGRLVDVAVDQEDPALAWPIVRQATTPPQNVWIAHKAGLDIDTPDAFSASQKLIFAGQVDAALDVKTPAVMQVPLITRSGRWDRVLDEPIMATLAGRSKNVSQMAVNAALHEVANDYAGSKQIWDDLLRTSSESQEGAAEAGEEAQAASALRILFEIDQGGQGGQASKNQFLSALFFCGRVQAVEEYLQQEDAVAAFSFYLAGNNHRKALEALGLKVDLSNFGEWFEEQKSSIKQNLAQRGPDYQSFEDCARVCSTLTSLGFRENAQQILDELIVFARQSRGKQHELWRTLLTWLGRAEARHMTLQAAKLEFQRMSNECQAEVLKGLFPEFEEAAETLWKSAPGDDEATKWLNLERLYVFDRAGLGDAWQSVVAAWLRRSVELLSERQMTADQLIAISKIATGLGDSELALDLLMVDLAPGFGQSTSVNLHWAEAARILVQRGKPEEALPLLESVRHSGNNPQFAYAEEVQTLLLCGQFGKAQALEQARWLRPLATTRFYQGYNYLQAAREFVDLHQLDRAAEYAETAFSLADLGSMDVYWSAGEFADILEEKGDFRRKADVLRAAWVESMQPFSSSMQYMLSNGYYSSLRHSAQKEKLSRSIVCIANQDMPGFRHHVEVAKRLQPQDVEMVCQCYPLLLKAGEKEIAEEIFASYERVMEVQIKDWPNDSTALNNLAWMYSQCDRKLPEALKLSQRAVELAPNSAIFLDTLAEIHFRAGRIDAALNTMRDCVRMDPREVHYRENLLRFRLPTHTTSPN